MSDGVPITRAEFDAQLERYLAALDDPDAELSDDDYVAITRLWNTIQHAGPQGTRSGWPPSRRASSRVRCRTSRGAGLELSKGMALYSADRDLYLGGAPHANSMYDVQR